MKIKLQDDKILSGLKKFDLRVAGDFRSSGIERRRHDRTAPCAVRPRDFPAAGAETNPLPETRRPRADARIALPAHARPSGNRTGPEPGLAVATVRIGEVARASAPAVAA